jgi:hypothetical protein
MTVFEPERAVDRRTEVVVHALFNLRFLTRPTDRPHGGHPFRNDQGLLVRLHHAARSANFA